jgi:hypothetical protein
MPLFVIFQPHLPAAAKEPAVFVLPVLSALPLDLSRTSLHQSNDHFTDRQTSVGPVLPVSSVPPAALSPGVFKRIFFYRRPSAWLPPALLRYGGSATPLWAAVSYFAQAAGRESISFLRRRNSTFRAIRETINSKVSGTRTGMFSFTELSITIPMILTKSATMSMVKTM